MNRRKLILARADELRAAHDAVEVAEQAHRAARDAQAAAHAQVRDAEAAMQRAREAIYEKQLRLYDAAVLDA